MDPAQEENKKNKRKITELLLNTLGACFLCLQDNEKYNEGAPVQDLNGGIIDLTNICRYLNINQCSLLLTCLKNDGVAGVEDLKRQPCSFSVNLSPKCLELTEKLNDKIIQWEKAKLTVNLFQLDKTKVMINFHLHTLHKVLEEGTKKSESWDWIDLQENTNPNSDNSLEAQQVQLLREAVKQKTLKILKKAETAMPQIILSRCKTPPPSPPVISHAHSFPPSLKLITSSHASTSVKTHLRQLIITNLLPSTTEGRQSRKSNRYRCPYCTKVMGPSKFAEHLSCLHSDKLLFPFFPPSQPPSEDICRQVLQKKVVDNSEKIPSTVKRPRSGCHLCGISYSKNSILKHHFLITHTDKLCEEILNFENVSDKIAPVPLSPVHLIKTRDNLCIKIPNIKDEFQDKKKRKITHKTVKALKLKRLRRSEENKVCTICGQTASNIANLRRHLATHHPDQLFLKCKPSWMGEEQFWGNCKDIFRREVEMATSGKSGDDKTYNCSYCPTGRCYKSQVNLVVHLAYKHRDKMERKLKKDNVGKMEDHDIFFGGDVEVMEEDASEFDMKPVVIGSLDLGLDELIMEHPYTDFEEDGAMFDNEGKQGNEVDARMMIRHLNEEQLEVPHNESELAPLFIKMEVQ